MMDMSATPTITLTQDQQSAADAFFAFLMSDEKFFNISGTAGTGKTFLMGWLSSVVMDTYQSACALMNVPMVYDTIYYTATTNKAAEVLEHSLKRPVQTIHSFMGLRVRNDFSSGKSFITKTQKWSQRRNIILFIDECSMIDSQLYQLIKETFIDCKVIYVGDHAQMAPVGEPLSKIYQDIAKQNFVVLRQPVRNAETPALVSLCSQLRETVETGIFHPIQAVPGVIEYLNDSRMERELHNAFTEHDPSCRALCYTNDRVVQYNQFIREDVRKQPSQIEVGDVLVVAAAVTSKSGQTLSVEREVLIDTIGPIEQDTRFNDILQEGRVLEYREVSCLSTSRGFEERHTVKVPLNMGYVSYLKQYYSKLKDWPLFFDLQENYADLRDKAACTVYKAQGSTYESVFVDLSNIGKSFDADQVARMLFVAISRAKKKVYLYGYLPKRYCTPK